MVLQRPAQLAIGRLVLVVFPHQQLRFKGPHIAKHSLILSSHSRANGFSALFAGFIVSHSRKKVLNTL